MTKNENTISKNEEELKNEADLKNEDDLKNGCLPLLVVKNYPPSHSINVFGPLPQFRAPPPIFFS